MSNTVEYPDLLGHTMTKVTNDGDEMVFTREDGKRFKFYHEQDCCESVIIEDVIGDLQDLVGSPITQAEEVSDDTFVDNITDSYDSHTWTFYKFTTNKGSVTVRWLGQSNGYYSESVYFCEC